MARVSPSHERDGKSAWFLPVTNKLEYMQAPAWVSRDGSGHKGKSKGKGGGKPRSYGKKAAATRWRKELESRTLEQTVVQRPPPLPRLHRTLPHTELLLNMALVSNVQDSEHRMR